jgi:DNA-directed RNA polymerase specialized sigma24 family protein
LADSESEQLLALLDPDPVRAEQKCKALWQRMVFYFRKNGACSPEDLAQEVFARAKSRIVGGQSVYAAQPESYFFGIARNVLREEWKRAKTASIALPEDAEELLGSCEHVKMERRLLLESCLQKLESDERAFVETYIHEGPVRTALVAGVSSNAASIRFHRLTVKLQALVQNSGEVQ